jgi:hypothetical protein
VGNKENPLEIDELRKELNLSFEFESLSMQSESSNQSRENEE